MKIEKKTVRTLSGLSTKYLLKYPLWVLKQKS